MILFLSLCLFFRYCTIFYVYFICVFTFSSISVAVWTFVAYVKWNEMKWKWINRTNFISKCIHLILATLSASTPQAGWHEGHWPVITCAIYPQRYFSRKKVDEETRGQKPANRGSPGKRAVKRRYLQHRNQSHLTPVHRQRSFNWLEW